ncbi:MAG: hypothetical protein V4538_14775 [Bacteroidota bacterium]
MATFTKNELNRTSFANLNPKLNSVSQPLYIRAFESVLFYVKNMLDFMKFLYFVIVIAMVVGVLFEIKCIYHIDIFQNVDTPFDTYFYSAKESMPTALQ